MVPKCIGYFPEYREVTGTPRAVKGPTWALVEEREGEGKRGGGAAPSLVQFGLAMGGHPCGPPLLFTKAHEGPLLPRGGFGNLPVLRKIPESLRNHSGVRI